MKRRILVVSIAMVATASVSCARLGCGTADRPASSQPAPGSGSAGVAASRPDLPAAPALPPVPTGPLTAADTASCDVAESLLKRIACIGTLAQHQRDPRYCDLVAQLSKQAGAQEPEIVRSGAAANSCQRSIAFLRNDPAMCDRISDPSMAGSCLSYFAMKRHDPKVCELGSGEAAPTCFLNEAARTRDYSLCLRTGRFQSDCEKRLGPVGR